MNLPKSPAFLGNFCKCVKILNFSSEIIFGHLLQTFGDFYLVTLVLTHVRRYLICQPIVVIFAFDGFKFLAGGEYTSIV